MSSRYTRLPDKFEEELLKADAFLNSTRTKALADKWGPNVQLKVINDAQHDILLSETQAEDQAFDAIFQMFGGLLESDGINADPDTEGFLAYV